MLLVLTVVLVMFERVMVLAVTLLCMIWELSMSLWLMVLALTVELSMVVLVIVEFTTMLWIMVELTIESLMMSDLLMFELLMMLSRMVLLSTFEVSMMLLLTLALVRLLVMIPDASWYVVKWLTLKVNVWLLVLRFSQWQTVVGQLVYPPASESLERVMIRGSLRLMFLKVITAEVLNGGASVELTLTELFVWSKKSAMWRFVGFICVVNVVFPVVEFSSVRLGGIVVPLMVTLSVSMMVIGCRKIELKVIFLRL